MIKTNGKNMIIELPNADIANDIPLLQNDIISVIKYFDYDNFASGAGCPFLMLLEVLAATLPNYEDLVAITEFNALMHGNTRPPSANELEEWRKDQTERFKIREQVFGPTETSIQ